VKGLAFKEAVTDTVVATLMNFPINWVLVAYAIHTEMEPLHASIMLTVVFSIIAVTRKTLFRVYFHNRWYQ
jgi:hypothetical protein